MSFTADEYFLNIALLKRYNLTIGSITSPNQGYACPKNHRFGQIWPIFYASMILSTQQQVPKKLSKVQNIINGFKLQNETEYPAIESSG